MKKPNFKHDCEKCVFLGEHSNYIDSNGKIISKQICDLYVCPQDGRGPTVVVRFSDDGADYKSGLTNGHICIKEAKKRAFEAEILNTVFDKDAADEYIEEQK